MALFLSRFDNRVDKKGRVSIPASWRAMLEGQPYRGVIIYPSFDLPCYEGCDIDRMDRIADSIDGYNPLGQEGRDFAVAIMGSSFQLGFDNDGRVVLPQKLVDFTGISETVCFVGTGRVFQIWRPESFEKFQPTAQAKAKDKAETFKWIPRTGPEGGGA